MQEPLATDQSLFNVQQAEISAIVEKADNIRELHLKLGRQIHLSLGNILTATTARAKYFRLQ